MVWYKLLAEIPLGKMNLVAVGMYVIWVSNIFHFEPFQCPVVCAQYDVKNYEVVFTWDDDSGDLGLKQHKVPPHSYNLLVTLDICHCTGSRNFAMPIMTHVAFG